MLFSSLNFLRNLIFALSKLNRIFFSISDLWFHVLDILIYKKCCKQHLTPGQELSLSDIMNILCWWRMPLSSQASLHRPPLRLAPVLWLVELLSHTRPSLVRGPLPGGNWDLDTCHMCLNFVSYVSCLNTGVCETLMWLINNILLHP